MTPVARSDAHCPHHADDRRRMRPRSQVRSPLELNGRGRVRDAKGSTHRSAKFQRELTIAGYERRIEYLWTARDRPLDGSVVPEVRCAHTPLAPLGWWIASGVRWEGHRKGRPSRLEATAISNWGQRPNGWKCDPRTSRARGFLTGRLSSKSFFRICAATHRPGFCGASLGPRIPNAQGGSSRPKLHRPAVSLLRTAPANVSRETSATSWMSALPIGHQHRTAASRMQGFGAGRPSHSQHRSRRQRAWTTNGSVQSGRKSPGPTSKPLTAGVTEAPALRTTLRTHRNLTSGPLASCWWDCVRERMTPVAMPKTRVPSSIGPVPLGLAAFGANDLRTAESGA